MAAIYSRFVYILVYLSLIIYVPIMTQPLHWSNQTWTEHSEKCATVHNGLLEMRCLSTGLVSHRAYTYPIRVEVDVLAHSLTDDPRFWAGLVLNGDVAADNQYAELAVVYDIEPYTAMGGPYIAHLTTPSNQCCELLSLATAGEWTHLIITYDGHTVTYTANDVEETSTVLLPQSFYIEVLCAGVNPGEPNNTSYARCLWKNLSIIGG